MPADRLFAAQAAIRALTASQPSFADEVRIGSHKTPSLKNIPTIMVHSYRALVRVVGYFKYGTAGTVLLRGQTATYGNLLPGAYRRDPRADADAEVEALLTDIRTAGLVDVSPPSASHSTEPLLQHYGIRTRWVDVVDSLPHALFFALYDQRASPMGGGMQTYVPSLQEWGYLYLLETGFWTPLGSPLEAVPGMWSSPLDLQICDLRSAKPSTALRPHAQHGLLCKGENTDLWPLVIAHLAVPVTQARSWLGGSEALSRETMFPARAWDSVYDALTGTKATRFWAARPWRRVDLGAITQFDFAP